MVEGNTSQVGNTKAEDAALQRHYGAEGYSFGRSLDSHQTPFVLKNEACTLRKKGEENLSFCLLPSALCLQGRSPGNRRMSEIVRVARSLIGTPYLHQGRLPKVGIDCIGVPILVAKELRLGDFDVAFPSAPLRADYPRTPNGTMVKLIKQVCAPLDDLQEGALLVFAIAGEPQHCAIASRYMDGWGMIHAWDIVGKVVEHRYVGNWRKTLCGIYTLPTGSITRSFNPESSK